MSCTMLCERVRTLSKGKKENRTTHPQKTHPGGGASASRLKDWSNRRPSYEGILSLLSLPTLNSLLTAIDQWGAGWGLLFWKAEACGLLVFLWHLAEYPLAVFGLVMTAGSYLVLSVIPWTGLLLFA